MENVNNGLKILSIIIIILGIIGTLAILVSFDYDTYKYAKENSVVYEEEYKVLSTELTTTWVYAISMLIVSSSIGMVMLTLDRMARTMESIDKKLGEKPSSKD